MTAAQTLNQPLAWWQTLPEDFYRHADGTELDAKHRFKVHGTAALDRALRTGLGTLMTTAMAPNLLMPARMARQRELLSFYRPLAERADVNEVFVRPPLGVAIEESDGRKWGYRPRNIPCKLLCFDSPFEPLNPELRTSYGGHALNRKACAQYWYHPSGPRPTLIFLHGFMADSFRFNSVFFSLPWLYKKGYDILLVTEPFHGYRREKRAPFSGYGYFSGGFAHANEAMLQAIHDVRIFMDYLQQQGAPHIGVSGLSLGGYLSALLACVDDRLAFCIPNSPVVAPIDMALEWQPIRLMLGSLMRLHHISVTELRHGMALHSPLTYTPKIDGKRLLIIGGAGDRLTPPRFVRLLHDHWQGSHLHWFPGNHVLHLGQGYYLKLMKWFMDRHTGLASP